MKEFLTSLTSILFLVAASFNSFAAGQFIWQYIKIGNFILIDTVIRTLHIGSFFFVLYLIVCLIRLYLIKRNLI